MSQVTWEKIVNDYVVSKQLQYAKQLLYGYDKVCFKPEAFDRSKV